MQASHPPKEVPMSKTTPVMRGRAAVRAGAALLGSALLLAGCSPGRGPSGAAAPPPAPSR